MESSYNKSKLSYGDLFTFLAWQYHPKYIVEFGILNGYSLHHFQKGVSTDTQIYAYDIFEQFVGNSAKRDIIERFSEYPNIHIEEADYYKKFVDISDGVVDILHIDIANDGDVYEFAINNYMSKLSPTGIIILEGGSLERDNVGWMHTYNKRPISDVLSKYREVLDIFTFNEFPSVTLIRRK